MKAHLRKRGLKTMKIKPWHNPIMLTSMKVSMLSIRAWALPMMNWFTHAIAWDLTEKQASGIHNEDFNRESQSGKAEEERRRDSRHSEKAGVCHFTDLILGLQCLKNCRNLGIMMLRGLFRASLSSNSDESSQIFCSAPKEPWKAEKVIKDEC